MTLKLIKDSQNFSKPGIVSKRVNVGGRIRKGQGTVVLQGISAKYSDKDHWIKRYMVRILNVKALDGASDITYDIEFHLRDDSKNAGSANINVLIIVDVDE
ncbi:MAG: hypothetical protein K2X28_07880 [Alphaproteobacteria bacterium]|jgi:hypothetical protein|nr:hypothetical protein [Alphaproteobacteria bacterium]